MNAEQHITKLRHRLHVVVDRLGRAVIVSGSEVKPLIAVARYPRIMRRLLRQLGTWLVTALGRWPDKHPTVIAVLHACQLLSDWICWAEAGA